jgi:hypothetical protein
MPENEPRENEPLEQTHRSIDLYVVPQKIIASHGAGPEEDEETEDDSDDEPKNSEAECAEWSGISGTPQSQAEPAPADVAG